MTKGEATKVINILKEVDGGCPVCVRAALESFEARFPEHKDLIDEARKEFG